MLTVALVAAAIPIIASVLFYQNTAQSVMARAGTTSISDHPMVYLGGHGAVAATSTQSIPTHEMNIANNGLVLLRGAHVDSISGSELHVSMSWGGSNFSWKIETNANTKFLTSIGQNATLADIQDGDFLTITGKLAGSGSDPTIQAEFVHE
jgi:hypothetical protein